MADEIEIKTLPEPKAGTSDDGGLLLAPASNPPQSAGTSS
jgi:hypothetical protein